VEYIQLALDYKPTSNLGQGFPDFAAPDHVTQGLADAATDSKNVLLNQYTRGFVSVQQHSSMYSIFIKIIKQKRFIKKQLTMMKFRSW
jgi:kynurenine--oxoglutarate transaminase/cysteine-S-conjugate beta-lyase/glutamine--phenylpyruvate transaminase